MFPVPGFGRSKKTLSIILRDVFVPLSEPLSAVTLEGTEGTFGAAPSTADTTTALSIVVASTITVRPISIDDYEVTGAAIKQLRMGVLLMRMLTLSPLLMTR
ncbi:hypothetical protein Tco_0447197, partial [Tanacetum coccineum]